MRSPAPYLLGTSLRRWVSARGFWLVALAALLPLVLTGAWAATHRADVDAVSIAFDPASVVEGDVVRVTALVRNVGPLDVGAFNASLAVGRVAGDRLLAAATQEVRIEGLAPGDSREIVLSWNATAGLFYVVATADIADEIGEVDEYDNQQAVPVAVRNRLPTQPPAAPEGLGEDPNATRQTDLSVRALDRGEGVVEAGKERRFAVVVENRWSGTVENAKVVLRTGRSTGGALFPSAEQTWNVTLEPGANATFELTWTPPPGAYWQQAWIETPAGHRDVAPADNHRAEAFTADLVLTPDFTPPAPPERLTIKEFYLDVLSLLHLRFLLPLVALFYAAGVISDEREQNALPYLLTRPVPRWLLPLTKFAASFVVAAAAAVVGLLLTYALLFGTMPDAQDVGFLSTPILATLLALFVYGGLFTLLGTLVERPYLVGAAFLVGWENVASIFVPWVANLTITKHIGDALSGWQLNRGLLWVPEGDVAVRALVILLIAGVAFLVAASTVMKRREFAV